MFDIIVDILHILATSLWVGGMFFLHFILRPATRNINPGEAGKLMVGIAKGFSITAWSSLIILIITGLLKTPTDMLFSFADELEIYLSLKHILVIAVILSGLIIVIFIVPKLKLYSPQEGQKPSENFIKYNQMVDKLSLMNLIIGVVIIILASMLW